MHNTHQRVNCNKVKNGCNKEKPSERSADKGNTAISQ